MNELLKRETMARALFEVGAPPHQFWDEVGLDKRELYLCMADVALSQSSDRAPQVPELPAQRRWLNDLIKAAEAFRVAMIQSGATVKVSQDRYFDQLRALERALNPMNYRDDAGQQSAASTVEPVADADVMAWLKTRWNWENDEFGVIATALADIRENYAAPTTSPEPDWKQDQAETSRLPRTREDLPEPDAVRAFRELACEKLQDMRAGWACDFKAPENQGQRGVDRTDALYEAIMLVKGLSISRNNGQGGGPRS